MCRMRPDSDGAVSHCDVVIAISFHGGVVSKGVAETEVNTVNDDQCSSDGDFVPMAPVATAPCGQAQG